MTNRLNHPYHLVENSPWPLLASLSSFILTTGLVSWFHSFDFSLVLVGVLSLLLCSGQWWRDISREGCFQGLHSIYVVSGLRLGVILFIVSEVCFFFSFFWAFFNSSLNPSVEVGGIWPPTGINAFNPFQVPLLNTIVLLGSGVSVTWCHHAVLENYEGGGIQGLLWTLGLGFYFSALQGLEYFDAPFSIADSVYGATFFVATGFHGAHVLIGTTFLGVCAVRMILCHFSSEHHMGLESAIWYWHFVDVVWLFLYCSIYWWGG